MSDLYAYTIDDNLYINLTNRCTNDCLFCVRRGTESYEGHQLWISHEPAANEVIAQMPDLSPFSEIVFCGFGEPTMQLSVLLDVARYAKQHGKRVRLNTNGLGSLYHGKDITPSFAGLIDTISISLNAPTAQEYDALCKPIYGESAYAALLSFAVEAAKHVPEVTFTVVDSIGDEAVAACEAVAKSVNIPLRVRKYIEKDTDI